MDGHFYNSEKTERYMLIITILFGIMLFLQLLVVWIVASYVNENENSTSSNVNVVGVRSQFEKKSIPVNEYTSIEIIPGYENFIINSSFNKVNYQLGNKFYKSNNHLSITYDDTNDTKEKYEKYEYFYYNRVDGPSGIYFADWSHMNPAFRFQNDDKYVTYSFPECNVVQSVLTDRGIIFPNVYKDVDYEFLINGFDVVFFAKIKSDKVKNYQLEITYNGEKKFDPYSIEFDNFRMMPPIIYNSSMEEIGSASYGLDYRGARTYLTVKFDSFEESQYPIYVDPTITDYSVCEDAQIRYGSGTSNYGTSGALASKGSAAGYYCSLIRYNMTELTNISLSRSNIVNADLHLYSTRSDSLYGGAYQMNDVNWSEGSVTWNNYFGSSQYPTVQFIEPALDWWYDGGVDEWRTFDVTEEINDALDESTPFCIGLAVSESDGSIELAGTSSYHGYVSSDSVTSSNHPYITIEYSYPEWVIDSYEAYDNQTIVANGIAITTNGHLYLDNVTLVVTDNIQENTFYINGTLETKNTDIECLDAWGYHVSTGGSSVLCLNYTNVRALGNTYFPYWKIYTTNSTLDHTTFYQNGYVEVDENFRIRECEFSQGDAIASNRGIVFAHNSYPQIMKADRITITNGADVYIGNFTDNSTIYTNLSGGKLILGNLKTIRVFDGNGQLLDGVAVNVQNNDEYSYSPTYYTGHDSWHGTGQHRRVPLYNYSYFASHTIENSYFNLSLVGYDSLSETIDADFSGSTLTFNLTLPVADETDQYLLHGDPENLAGTEQNNSDIDMSFLIFIILASVIVIAYKKYFSGGD